ncbi:MAG TPA: FAD-binding protein, partial [Acidimicrobiales bacterium]|nr:FAD-binding protein [Acidimicrobiales bacterium]
VVRGGAENTGVLHRAFAELDAVFVGDGFDLVAVDARSPEFDGGPATAIDAAGFGILIDSDARMLYDSSGSEWSVARTEVGSAVVGARGGRAAVCWDGSSHGRFAPTPWAPERAESLSGLARALGVDAGALEVSASSLQVPPFFGVWARPGVTFSRRGFLVDPHARIVGGAEGAFPNVFAAGEAMAGSIRPFGYRRGLGLTIAGVWGRIAAQSASDVG